jgi:hypothetical protein
MGKSWHVFVGPQGSLDICNNCWILGEVHRNGLKYARLAYEHDIDVILKQWKENIKKDGNKVEV